MKNHSTIKRLLEGKKSKTLTDKGMKDMIPMFVKGQSADEDHKCGSCSMRVLPDRCTVVEGNISMERGTCLLWARGKASSSADEAEQRATKSAAGYVEADKVNCGSCAAYANEYGGYCRVWGGKVKSGDCCVIWFQ